MLLAWLRADAGEAVLREGWVKHDYRPRHGKLPLLLRVSQTGIATVNGARNWYLNSGTEDAVAGTTASVTSSAVLRD